MLRKFFLMAMAMAWPAAAKAADWESMGVQYLADIDISAAYVAPDKDSDGFGAGAGGTGILKFGETGFFLQGNGHLSQSFHSDKDDEAEFANAEVKGFWRSPDSGMFGVLAGYQHLGLGDFDSDAFRAGLLSQIYGSEIVTFSLGAGIFAGENQANKDFDGYYLQGGAN